MTNNFPTSVDVSTLRTFRPDPRPDEEQRKKIKRQQFWFLVVPVAAFLAFGLCILLGANVFLPAWAVFCLVGWGISEGLEEK
jgi:hypothetical protein